MLTRLCLIGGASEAGWGPDRGRRGGVRRKRQDFARPQALERLKKSMLKPEKPWPMGLRIADPGGSILNPNFAEGGGGPPCPRPYQS
jgi:hypothetical protein